ncbi:MAG TPA: hypothetical protein VGL57_01175 [Solirubrobacteraceae bacterium]|jgi:hypothetical protein
MAALALRAYPSKTREARGEEILATLLECGERSTGRLVRELADLVRFGLRARAIQSASVGYRRLIADGLCLAGMLFLAQDLATALRSRGVPHALYSSTSIALLAMLLAIGLVGRDRLAGAGALAWTALRLPGLIAHHLEPRAYAGMVVPAFCLLVMVLAPRVSALDGFRWLTPLPGHRRRWLAIAAAVLLALLLGPSVLMLSAIIIALVRLPVDPRMAIVLAVTATSLAIGKAHAPVLISAFSIATPAMLAFTIVRTQRLQRLSTLGAEQASL